VVVLMLVLVLVLVLVLLRVPRQYSCCHVGRNTTTHTRHHLVYSVHHSGAADAVAGGCLDAWH
jgi:hypothetical protein